MKLLIIGGTGVLSSAVVDEALAHGIEVTIVNRGRKKNILPAGVNLIKVDYRDRNLFQAKLKDLHFDAVIDFICYTKAQIAYSIDLLHSIANQYIFISTTCVYDTSVPGVKSEDDLKVLKSWSYSVNKWECECYLAEQAKSLGFNYSVVRPCVTYDDTRIPYGIMPLYGYHWTFVSRILHGKPIIRWNGGKARWNMMRVEDFAVGVIGIIGNPKAYGEAYNLCGDDVYTWNDVIDIVSEYVGRRPSIVDLTAEQYMSAMPERSGEISGRSYDSIISNQKIKELVPNYATNYDLRKGIYQTLKAYKEQNYQRGIDWKFDANIDRIIKKYAKGRFDLGFVDYLGTATAQDKKVYWVEMHRENPFVKLYTFAKRVQRYVFSKISR